MKKKQYIAPETTQVLMTAAVQIMATSNENGAYGSDSDAKENEGVVVDDDDDLPVHTTWDTED